ncbi:protein FAM83H isoform X2 [Xyrichtys novacula]|uniref:Protein FAM83H isoform X2 n=1 Tax=Xyrichtys novacula TaxID=13765 RepID=A0AAV1HBV9_XYRNO|nr:protein FAM83H isoform X2 [Xyrichtys novacula]
MPNRSQSSSIGDNPLDPNYLPPHYREEYRLAIDALIEQDIKGYYEFLQSAEVVGFLAQPEIELIRSTIQTPNLSSSIPELTYHEGGHDVDGSSDTYWPMQSDLAAPGLDLGWPVPQQSFRGPTEVTTLVNPSDPDMPSIKEQARRLIKSACQVIAVVMDIFTDVDIFADLLEATSRHVPVYILLDEQDVHHFSSMVINCKVNLELNPFMRVRTVAGITYHSRTGKSFKGQVKDRFLLADCRAVLSGNYSFMWSYEKIHRCIAHLFLGELVATFDEEFRILFAQSEPLVIDPSDGAFSDTSSTSSYFSSQFGLKRTQSLRNPIGYRRPPEITSGFPYGDTDRNLALPFRRNDPFRHTLEPGAGITIGKYSQQQFRLQQSYLEQGRSLVSRQMEMSASGFKRHSYAEGTQENYVSSRQYMKHRVMTNLDEPDYHRDLTKTSHFYSEGPGPGSGQGHYDRLRVRTQHLSIDQHSESSFRSDQEPPPGNHGRDYFSSEDLRGPEGHHAPLAGRYGGGSSHKRPTIGQAYACQSSPTQLHPPEKKHFPKQSDQEHEHDPEAKHGLRNWRIHSYLSSYEDGAEEGLPQPLGPDAFEDPPSSQQPTDTESSALLQPNAPSKSRPEVLRPRFGKPILPESNSKDSVPTTTKDLEKKEREAAKERERETDKGAGSEMGVDVEMKEGPDLFLSKHESFRSRINPLLQRSSRLRSSLIFSSSKAEMHSGGLGLKPASETEEELDSLRTSSVVAQILEKRRSLSRDPYEWRKKADELDKEKEKEKEDQEKEKEAERERERDKEREKEQERDREREKEKEKERERVKEKEREREREKERQRELERQREKEKEQQQKHEVKDIRLKYETIAKEEPQKTNKEVKTIPAVEKSGVTASTSLNMNDPASRLQYFQDLAAKRKASKMETESSPKVPEPVVKKPDLSDKPPVNTPTALKVPTVSVSSAESQPKKPDIAAKLAELSRKPSVGSSKPPIITAKPYVSPHQKALETSQAQKEETATATEGQKKDIFKSLKPLPSPKIFRRDPLKLKGLNPRRISCGEEILTTDATDAEKSELRKNRSQSSSTLPRDESKEGLQKTMGSNTSINTLGETKEGKTLDFLKKQTQRLKGFLGPKDKEKKSSGDEKSMSTVAEHTDDSSKKPSSIGKSTGSSTATTTTDQTAANHKTTTTTTSGPTRYQAQGNSVIFSSNLRDDTKVILEQISANSQKNRLEREEAGGGKESDTTEKALERQNSLKKSRFLRPPGNIQEREGLLKRIESLRKEKKVYSRFEMGNNLG